MIREALRMGDPRLWRVSAPVETFGTRELEELLQDMRDTMAAQNGAGLAAPQIGVGLRVVIFGVVNPVLTPLSADTEEGWEGCLSVPGLRGVVPRYAAMRYEGFDPRGRPIRREVTGFHARVVQHECDHLDGILYPMRMTDMRRFGYTEILFPDSAGDED